MRRDDLDYGHHPFKKGWKIRGATDFYRHSGLAWTTVGTTDYIERSDTYDYPASVTCA